MHETTGSFAPERNIVVDNHARKADARRSTGAGNGTHRQTVGRTTAKPRIPTGLNELDTLLHGGLRPGRLTVLAARSAMGKSMLALAMARNCARLGRPALVCSLEMDNRSLLERMLAAESGLPTSKVRHRNLDEAERVLLDHAMEPFLKAPLHFGGDGSTPRVPDIAQQCAAVQEQQGALDLLVVDYLGLIEGARRTSRGHEIGKILQGLRELAVARQRAVVLVHHLTRAPELREDHRPRLSDMEDAEQILAYAETVILLYREHYYVSGRDTGRYERSPDPRLYAESLFPRNGLPEPGVQEAELHVPYNRHGRTGMVKVGVDLSRASYFDLPASGLPQP